jgi:hypothetical protein
MPASPPDEAKAKEDQARADQMRMAEQKEREEQNRAQERSRKQPAMKLWKVAPVNANDPPFYFSNVSVELIVAAENEEIARKVAIAEAGGEEAWGNPETSKVEEYKADSRGVISRRND